MHGLKTINALNELAAQNAPGAAQIALEAADASRVGKPSVSEQHFKEATEAAKASREAIIASLANKPLGELLGMLEALQLPTTLEAALARKLAGLSRVDVRSFAGDNHAQTEEFHGQGHA
jgi:hypothetical protein